MAFGDLNLYFKSSFKMDVSPDFLTLEPLACKFIKLQHATEMKSRLKLSDYRVVLEKCDLHSLNDCFHSTVTLESRVNVTLQGQTHNSPLFQ